MCLFFVSWLAVCPLVFSQGSLVPANSGDKQVAVEWADGVHVSEEVPVAGTDATGGSRVSVHGKQQTAAAGVVGRRKVFVAAALVASISLVAAVLLYKYVRCVKDRKARRASGLLRDRLAAAGEGESLDDDDVKKACAAAVVWGFGSGEDEGLDEGASHAYKSSLQGAESPEAPAGGSLSTGPTWDWKPHPESEDEPEGPEEPPDASEALHGGGNGGKHVKSPGKPDPEEPPEGAEGGQGTPVGEGEGGATDGEGELHILAIDDEPKNIRNVVEDLKVIRTALENVMPRQGRAFSSELFTSVFEKQMGLLTKVVDHATELALSLEEAFIFSTEVIVVGDDSGVRLGKARAALMNLVEMLYDALNLTGRVFQRASMVRQHVAHDEFIVGGFLLSRISNLGRGLWSLQYSDSEGESSDEESNDND
ncbi:hypothetical protein BESB_073370 [Besnoitia besnoiti]|uniref:Transmembrane protein n=1 Tax=Besnoitia besnoiti TaxID=94643 RepID=A0A2A9M867_BESBE|nr:uncharacterized protein BESB_073370 [Besnoitia besnoiti]PFH34185.1 hypothetical protein BESB_073370 [Besnoitia besnoiti]